ncbi:MAPEG family protein [Emcibacter sp.]|uniref:MAPEG family protein n=1 Tax=Emcibacter sp. TaxID=1979954 RepID=UPI002AA8CB5F|nr:MAPEG family protein [Emcibacter sp.]
MTEELYWLTLTALMTGLFWLPYILNRLKEQGLGQAVFQGDANTAAQAPWAQRMMKAHKNAVENLVIFAPLVLVVHLAGLATALTASAAMIYFYTRLAHFIVYSLGIPALRTLAFAVGFVCQLVFALTALGLM